jgi:hypothetical protein
LWPIQLAVPYFIFYFISLLLSSLTPCNTS